jgi:hypothetical protein
MGGMGEPHSFGEGRIFFREVPLSRILSSFKAHLFPPPGDAVNTASRSPGAFRCMSGRKKGHIIAMWPSCIHWRHQGDKNDSINMLDLYCFLH